MRAGPYAAAGWRSSPHMLFTLSVPDDFMKQLTTWANDVQVVEAAQSRRRQRSLQQQAEESSTLVGMLVDLAERGTTIAIRTMRDVVHTGIPAVVATDFVLVRNERVDVLVRLADIATVRVDPSVAARPATGDRPAALTLTFFDALFGMVHARPRVVVGLLGAAQDLLGELQSVGTDLVSLRADGSAALVHIPHDAIVEVTLLDRLDFN